MRASILLMSLVACGDKTESVTDTAEAVLDAPFTPTMPTAQCGMPDYEWRSTERMGTLVAHEDVEGLTFSADTLNALIQNLDAGAIVGEVDYGVETFFVRYLTQDRGEEVEATGMIVMPDMTGEAPVLLWLHPTVGFSDECAPSAQGIEGAAFGMLFAAMGFIVVAPDYIGMSGYEGESSQGHPYITAEPTAIASLDALRALDRLLETTTFPITPARDRLVLWGASQGGFAALWADRYLPHYTPHYTPVGVIAAIPPTDMFGLAAHGVQTSGPASLALAAAQITMNEWYQAGRPLSDVFADDLGERLSTIIAEECEDFSALEGVETVEDLYAPAYIEGISSGSYEPWTCFLEESTLRLSEVPHDTDTPTFMVLAEDDDLAIASYARDDITALCDQGYRIEHLECAGLGHVDGALNTLKRQLAWAEARAAGDDWDSSGVCVINEPEDCEAEAR
ncbi:MAG: pimeloyl-ACP methyl ester carboxylesterase [Myxococcota bacterium]|jgi:pimeloyl-ACP methyl ester carboxylesterase